MWRSQPLILGKHPAGNIMLSFGILMAGASVRKGLTDSKHVGMSAFKIRKFFSHQKRFILPAILKHWESYREGLLNKVKLMDNLSWCGGGRFDSMGHSAKYGAYSMFCSSADKILHFELLQVIANIYHTGVGCTYKVWISYPVDKSYLFVISYPVDSELSTG